MAVNIRVDRVVTGITSGLRQDSIYQNLGIALSGTSVQTNTLPGTGTFPIGYSYGQFRIKIYNGAGTSPTLASLKVLVGDGTNTILVYALNPATAHNLTSTSWFDETVQLLADVALTGSGGGATGQLIAPTSSVVGGINTITVQTILGGTSPTATMDLECVMAI